MNALFRVATRELVAGAMTMGGCGEVSGPAPGHGSGSNVRAYTIDDGHGLTMRFLNLIALITHGGVRPEKPAQLRRGDARVRYAVLTLVSPDFAQGFSRSADECRQLPCGKRHGAH